MKKLLTLLTIAIAINYSNAQTTILSEDFESGTLGAFVNANTLDSLVWNNTGIRGGDPGHSPTQTAYFGNPADTTFVGGGLTEGADLTSTVIDLSLFTVVRLSFNYFLETENADFFDIATVSVSTDSITFTPVADNQPSINNLDETPGGWQSIDIDISAFAGNPTVYVRFSFNSGDGAWNFFEGWYVDDVLVYEPAAADLGVIAIDSLASDCGLSAAESVTVRVKNFGTTAQSNIPVSYRINAGAPVNDTITATIIPGDTLSFTFDTTADLSVAGTYIFDGWTSMPGDGNNNNDSTTNLSIVNIPTISTFPYSEDFETGNGGWTSGGTNNSWQFGTPAATFIASAASGVNGWVTSLISNYNPSELSFLISPCLDFTGFVVDPILRFSHIFITNAGDQGWVEYSTDDGSTWTKLGTTTSGGTNWYNAFGDVWDGNSGAPDTWRTAQHELTGLAGQDSIRIRFIMSSGAFFQDEGFGVDSVEIFNWPNDVGVIAIDAPVSGCGGLTATEPVTVRVKNFGAAVQTSIPVSFDDGTVVTETWTGTLNSGDTVSYTFTATSDLLLTGTYVFDSYTSLIADSNAANDSTLNYIVNNDSLISIFPYSEDFEAEPLCTEACAAACPLTGAWRNVLTDNIDWTVDEGGTPSFGTGPAVDATTGLPTGNYSYIEASGGCNPSAVAVLVSPCFDISTLSNPTMTFWYHMFGVNMGNLYVDIYSGGSWTTVDSIIGQQQTADTVPWIKETINLSSFSGVIQVRFRGITGPGFESDMAIDDIAIFQPPPDDLGVIAIDAPVSGCGLTATDSVTVRVLNFGSTAQDTILVSYRINAGPPVSDTIIPTILPGDTLSFTFTTTADLSLSGTYVFDAWTGLVGDVDITNDSTINYLVNSDTLINTFPYFENFESGTGSWLASGVNSTWAFGTPAKDTINSAGSGVNSWVTGGLAPGFYNSNENSQVLGPCFDFSTLVSPIIEMLIWWNSEFSWDGAVLQSSIDSGATWQNVGAFGDPNNWFTDNTIDANPGGQQEGWTGRDFEGNGSSGWVLARHNLTGLGGQSNVRLRIAFGSDGLIEDDGFAFDDVAVFEGPPDDVGVIAINAPNSGCGLSATESVTIQVYNFGSALQDTIPVSYRINAVPAVNETIFDTILPGDTLSYTFSAIADLSLTGLYVFDAWTELIGDADNTNDSTLNYTVIHDTVISTFPYIENFETEPLCTEACAAPCPLTGFWFNTLFETIDWTVDENGTPSVGTGPAVDHTLGDTTGNYLYTEASFGCSPGAQAIVISPCFDITALSNPQFSFWYHMFGVNMGNLYIYINSGGVWTLVDSIIGQQQTADTDPWLQRVICLSSDSGVIRVGFQGITGGGFESDIAIDDIEIFDAPANITANGPTSFCAGDSVELVSDTAVAYDWLFNSVSTGVTTINYFADTSGNYQVVVTGCIDTSAIETVNVNPIPTANITASGPTTFCAGDSVELISDTAVAYDWLLNGVSTGITSINYYASAAGNYQVVVTSDSGCVDTSAVDTITVNSLPVVTIGNDTSICQGSALSLDAGNPGATYNWSTFELTQIISVSTADTFWVDVTDTNGCVNRDSILVTIDPLPVVNLGNDTSICQGSALSLDAGNPGGSYNWSTTDSTQIISVSTADTFWVDVTDGNGCTTRDSIVVTINPVPIVDLGPDTTQCGGSVTLDAGNPGDTYNWSTTDSTQTIAVSATGTYWVDVTNAFGCTTRDSIDVTINPVPLVNLGPDTIQCGGIVTLDAGNPGATYNWSTTETTKTIVTGTSGTYWVDVTNVFGCTTRDSINVTIYPAPLADFSFTTVCDGDTVQFGDLSTVSSGSIITWGWDFGDASTDSIQNPSHLYAGAGTYTVQLVVTTDNGCIDTVQKSVTVNPVPVAGFSFTTECEGSPTQFTDTSSISSGSVTSWFWNFGDAATSTLKNPTHLYASAGTYNVQLVIASNNGCQDVISDSVTVNPLPAANITASGPTTICNGDSVELVSDTAITYDWLQNSVSTGVISINYFASAAADYQVIVTNAFGCTDTSAVETVAISIPVVSVTPDPGVICVAGVDSVTLTASGAVSYTWAPAVGLSSTSGTSVNASPPNDTVYTVIGTDSIGCTDTTTVLVQQSVSNPVAIFTAADTIGCGSITVTFNNTSTDAITYSWALPGGTTADTTVQNPVVTYSTVGTYDVTLTAYGCGAADSTITKTGYITVNPVPTANITPGGPTTFCVGDSVELASDTAAGNDWLLNGISTGATGINYYASATGNYQVVVTNAFGCADTSAVETVTVNLLPVANIIPGAATLCAGDSVELVSDPATTYDWLLNSVSTGVISSNYFASVAADYQVVVSNAGGCIDTSTIVTVTVNPVPVVDLGPDTTKCGGTVTLDANNVGATFNWSTGESTQTIIAVSTGTYWVDVTNAFGCITRDSNNVVINVGPPVVNLGPDLSACVSTVLDAGANPGSTFNWNTGDTLQTITVTFSDTFWVAVTNACTTVSDTILVTINPFPVVNLGADTVVCDTAFALDAGNAGAAFIWSTADTTQTIIVSATGTYWVDVISGCTTRDSINVTFIAAPIVDLGVDTTICGGTLTLDANNAGAAFTWSTSDTTQTITVSITDIYWVDVTIGGCITRDSINVISLPVSGTVSATAETVLNANDGTAWISLTTGTGPFNYAWLPGAFPDNDTIIGLSPGIYCVTVTDANNCTFNGCDTVAPGPTGLNQISDADRNIKLYPNPNEGIFTVSFTGFNDENVTLSIIDLHGISVINEELLINGELNKDIDISGLSKGLYMLKVNTSDRVLIKKILIE
ncbi:MAG: PKD domain-containing protein [Cytophagales bacterium]|nr:PKD domain-containing protein [Cytophagales bacterium]